MSLDPLLALAAADEMTVSADMKSEGQAVCRKMTERYLTSVRFPLNRVFSENLEESALLGGTWSISMKRCFKFANTRGTPETKAAAAYAPFVSHQRTFFVLVST